MEFFWIQKWEYPCSCIRKEYYIANRFFFQHLRELSEVVPAILSTEENRIYLATEC